MKQTQTITMLVLAIIVCSCSGIDDEQKQLIKVDLRNKVIADVVTTYATYYYSETAQPAIESVYNVQQAKKSKFMSGANSPEGSLSYYNMFTDQENYVRYYFGAPLKEDIAMGNIKKARDDIPPFIQSMNAELTNDLAKTQEDLDKIGGWIAGNKALSAEDSTRFADTAPYSYLMACSNLNDSICSEMIEKCEDDNQLWKDVFSNIAVSGKKSKIYGLQYRILMQYYLTAIEESDIKVDYIAPYETENDKAETYEIGFSNKQAFLGTFHKENDKWVLDTEDWEYDATLIGMGID